MRGRNLLQYFILALKGMAMGAADVVPGVSGGTIAFISGIYEELISSLSNIGPRLISILRREGVAATWKALNGNFLLAVFVGIAISIISLARLISWLLVNQPILLWSFFFGLVLASIFFVARGIRRWSLAVILFFVAGAVLAYFITSLPPSQNSGTLPYLFLSGALAVCAMILPGISGAFILVLLGSYKTVLDAVHERDLIIIATVGAGAVFGLLSFAKLLKWMFGHYKNITLALLTGFILGSLNKIWPWKVVLSTREYGDKVIAVLEKNVWPWAFEGNSQLEWAILLSILGFCLIFVLERLASRQ